MPALTGFFAVFAIILIAYITINISIFNKIAFWKNLNTLPSTETTKEVSSFNINFAHVGYNGDINHYTNPSGLLNFPGPDLSDEVCTKAKYLQRDLGLCFRVEKRAILVSDPYYPATISNCDGTRQCLLQKAVPAGIQIQFSPRHGLAPTLIPSAIDAKLALYNASALSLVNHTGIGSKHLWIRLFLLRYEGSYSISSRPFSKFNFTFLWPSLLPTGQPKFIYGFCQKAEIKDGTCSTDAFI
ncbi:hypothetical protein DSO57_1032429 [Entomophthora muscae]|uniref:Uncharacterized protein n=1 Tax=Entomophthora muscae TaxID=34485 RepID=A0ACC2UMD6_9FUNG|nr:hypothetical protein DSO57_1032429 [Entomophthora muscae]